MLVPRNTPTDLPLSAGSLQLGRPIRTHARGAGARKARAHPPPSLGTSEERAHSGVIPGRCRLSARQQKTPKSQLYFSEM